MNSVIQIRNLKKYYVTARGVENVNLDLYPGEILGFIGPNGAGKSTVIRTLMGLIQKTSGEIKIFDGEQSFRNNKNIGYLPSEVFLYSELTVRKQLQYFASIRHASEEKINELAEKLDLDLNRKIKDLSFGNRKKVGIIAALMHSPQILILDEPTSGLDPLIQQQFFMLLEETKKQGTAILLSSHVLNEVEKICDRVALIKDGVILFSESLENIKKNKYKKVFISPIIDDFNLEGLSYLNRNSKEIIYSYYGDINLLIEKLSYYRLNSLKIEDLELEEIFMHYYKRR